MDPCVRPPSQQRRDLEQQKLDDLKAEMGVLEKDFASEVQRRVQTTESLHTVLLFGAQPGLPCPHRPTRPGMACCDSCMVCVRAVVLQLRGEPRPIALPVL